jgi:copper chaperone CopZ
MKKIILLLMCVTFVGIVSAQQVQNQRANRNSNRETVVFAVKGEGIHCQNCVNNIQRQIAFERGVTKLDIDRENDLVTVEFRKDRTSVEKLKEAFAKIKKEVEVKE